MSQETTNKTCKCPHCGSTDFTLIESLVWKCHVDEDDPKQINCFHKTGEIDTIICAKCEEDITELNDNESFQFNFN